MKSKFDSVDFKAYLESGEKWAEAKLRLSEIRQSICERSVSYGELVELESLSNYIESDDVQLLEWAGVPESV